MILRGRRMDVTFFRDRSITVRGFGMLLKVSHPGRKVRHNPDGKAIGKCVCILREHNHFVQGVAWDPLGEYIATQSSDRSVCVYKVDTSNKKVSTKLLGKVSRLPIPKGAHAEDPLQEDDTGERSAVPEPGTELSERPSSPTPAMSIKGKEVLRSGVMPVPSAPAPSADVSMAINLDEADAGTTSGVEDAGGDEDVAMASSANPSGDAAATPAAPTKHGRGPNKSYRMFHDDTLKSFFRRLAFSNDGSMLFAPAGQYKSIRAKRNGGEASSAAEDTARSRLTTSNTVLVFARSAFQRLPIAHFPGHKKPTVAVRFNPIHFAYRLPSEAGLAANALAATEVRDEVSTPITPPNIDMASRAMFQLRQRLVFAVATTDTVLIYDTQQQHPICAAQNLHYAPITDVAW